MLIDFDGTLVNLDYIVKITTKKSGETVQITALLDDYKTEAVGWMSIDEWDDLKFELTRS